MVWLSQFPGRAQASPLRAWVCWHFCLSLSSASPSQRSGKPCQFADVLTIANADHFRARPLGRGRALPAAVLDPASLLPYYQRLSIPLIYVIALCFQALIGLALTRVEAQAGLARTMLANLASAGIAWLVLLLGPGLRCFDWPRHHARSCVLGRAGSTDTGLAARHSDPVRDSDPAPLAFDPVRWSKLDMAIAAAFGSWRSPPGSSFRSTCCKTASMRPSDRPQMSRSPIPTLATTTSLAQSLLIGYPYLGEIPSRPLYVVLLAGLHSLLGERYDLIIAGQTLVLAVIPVLVFWLGSAIHSRPAGVIAAVAAIGREWTSLMVSSATRVSNTKMLLVDLPTLLAMLLCCLLVLRWLDQKDARSAAYRGWRLRTAFVAANSNPGVIADPADVRLC